jgi:glutathione S-transferase
MGDFDLSRYPAIGEWIERIKSHPSFVPMFKADAKNWQVT